tara:strand:+ start:4286 stop:5290 length:1005 start_codon:yes stop_codon:yes gene_type:complete
MEEDILKEVLSHIDNSVKNDGKFIKLDDCEPIEITPDNFKKIEDIDVNGKICFIDGGNAEILKAANFSLQFIRVYYTVYLENKRVENKKYEFYILINSVDKNGKIFFNTKIFGDKIIKEFEISSLDKSIMQGNSRADVSFVGNVARRFAELSVGKELILSLNQGDTVIFDGSLDVKYNGEKELLDEIYNKSKDVDVCGLSKTCELFTDKGGSVVGVLNEIQPSFAWYYHPLAKFDSILDICFVKLNENSKYIFRLDFFKNEIDNVLSLLSLNSKDPVFLGYPYGLIEADRFARISNKELEILKTKFMIKAGKDWKSISNLLRTKDSHGILDNIS